MKVEIIEPYIYNIIPSKLAFRNKKSQKKTKSQIWLICTSDQFPILQYFALISHSGITTVLYERPRCKKYRTCEIAIAIS